MVGDLLRPPPTTSCRAPCLRRPAPTSPRFFAKSRANLPSGWGSRASGPGPDQLRRCPATRRVAGGIDRPRPASFPCARAAARASSSVRRTKSMPCSSLVFGGAAGTCVSSLPVMHRTADTRPRSSSRRSMSTCLAAQPAGMSSSTAAVTNTCSADSATVANARRRAASSSANTSSSNNTGSLPSARNNSYDASRSATAKDHDSPWLAKPFAGCSPNRSSRSSRCGPTRHIPRSSSASRRAANAASSAASRNSRSLPPASAAACAPRLAR